MGIAVENGARQLDVIEQHRDAILDL